MPDYKKATRRAARKIGVDPALLEALVQQESGFNPHARSPAGAQGIAQFMPGTAPAYGVNLHDNRAMDDLLGAARYLKANLKRTGGNVKEALSIYNSGRPEGYKSIPETANYVRTILASKGNYASGGGGGSSPSMGGGGSSSTTYSPGADNSAQRRQLLAMYLLNRGQPDALLQLQAGLQNAQDTPGTYTTKTTAGSNSSSSSGGGRAGKSKLLELIYNSGQGGGYAVKNGKKVNGPSFYSSVWAGHKDHVHVAAGPKTVVELGKLAQSMGLHVGENPHFGGVDPVHVPGSYHYRGEAIDVSGDPGRMRAFARRVSRLYGIK